MALRPTWKGFLKVSLVNIPVKVFPATEPGATLSFNQLHSVCQTRIQQKRWCPSCEREVANTELSKGYEFEKGRYVVVTDEDLEKVRVDTTRVINLVQFSDEESLDPIYVDRAYYLAPDGPMGGDAFAVMREGMKGKVGIGKLALYGREYLVAVKPQGRGLVMYTLHHAAEIRSMNAVDELGSIPAQVKPEEIKLAKQVIGTFDGKLDPEPVPRRLPGRPDEDHRGEDSGRRGGGARDRSASEGRQSNGSAQEESRLGERGTEEDGQGRGASQASGAGGRQEARTSLSGRRGGAGSGGIRFRISD